MEFLWEKNFNCQKHTTLNDFILLNFSTLNPTVGTMLWYFSSSDLKWLSMVDFPELSSPKTRTLHSFFLRPRKLANLSKSPMAKNCTKTKQSKQEISIFINVGVIVEFQVNQISFSLHTMGSISSREVSVFSITYYQVILMKSS